MQFFKSAIARWRQLGRLEQFYNELFRRGLVDPEQGFVYYATHRNRQTVPRWAVIADIQKSMGRDPVPRARMFVGEWFNRPIDRLASRLGLVRSESSWWETFLRAFLGDVYRRPKHLFRFHALPNPAEGTRFGGLLHGTPLPWLGSIHNYGTVRLPSPWFDSPLEMLRSRLATVYRASANTRYYRDYHLARDTDGQTWWQLATRKGRVPESLVYETDVSRLRPRRTFLVVDPPNITGSTSGFVHPVFEPSPVDLAFWRQMLQHIQRQRLTGSLEASGV